MCIRDRVTDILWQVTLPGSLVPTNVGPATAGVAEEEDEYLVLPNPENYVGPGFNGQRTIVCSQQLRSSLFSPGKGVVLITGICRFPILSSSSSSSTATV